MQSQAMGIADHVFPLGDLLRFLSFLAYGSCPDALVALSSTAPAHPHATRVAAYPALFLGSGPEGDEVL